MTKTGWWPITISAAFAVAGLATSAHALQRIPDRPICASCSITAQTRTTLGTSEGPGALSSSVVQVVADPQGRYWVLASGAMPILFDHNGVFVQTVGRSGPGPGEFQSPGGIWFLPGDSVIIKDSGINLHLFDPDLRYVRTLRMPLLGSRGMVVLDWPTSVVVNALHPRPPEFGLPLHEVDFSGPTARVARSFGGNGEPVNSSTMYTRLPHALTPARGGGYWTATSAWYNVSKWSAANRELLSLERRPDWFPGESDMGSGGPEKPPSPRCLGVSEDDAGLLWSFCLVPSPDYKAAWQRVADQMKSGVSEIPVDAIDWELVHDTKIEVIDPVSRSVVAVLSLDESVTAVLPNREVAILEYSGDGVPTLKIVRLTLQGYTRR